MVLRSTGKIPTLTYLFQQISYHRIPDGLWYSFRIHQTDQIGFHHFVKAGLSFTYNDATSLLLNKFDHEKLCFMFCPTLFNA